MAFKRGARGSIGAPAWAAQLGRAGGVLTSVFRVVVVAVSVWLAGLGATAQAALQLRDRGPIDDLVRSDGVRYIASQSRPLALVTVLDVISGTRRTIPQLGGCVLADFHHAELLWACRQTWPMQDGAVQDLASGRVEMLPPLAFIPQSASSLDWGYSRLGKRFATIFGSGYKEEFIVYVDRRTKSQRQLWRDRRDWVVDLDGPRLTRKLCRGQRRGMEYDNTSAPVPGPLATAGRWAATLSYEGAIDDVSVDAGERERLELQRCGARIRTIALPIGARASQPVINDRFMAWTETHSRARAGGPTYYSRVAVRVHRSGQIRRSEFTNQPRDLSLLLVGRRLFAVQTRSAPAYERRLMSVELRKSGR